MAFDSKYTYFRFMENIMNARRPKVMGKPSPSSSSSATTTASGAPISKGDNNDNKKVAKPTPQSLSTATSRSSVALPINTVAVSGVNPNDPSERDMMIGGLRIRVRDKTDEEMARDAAVQSLIRQWQEEKAKASGNVPPLTAQQRADLARATLQQMETNDNNNTSSSSSSLSALSPNETKVWLPGEGEILQLESKKQLEDQVRAMLQRWEEQSDLQRQHSSASAAAPAADPTVTTSATTDTSVSNSVSS
jgi:hypothetical protein